MSKEEFEIGIGMDIRAYGSVTVKAKSLDKAIAKLTGEYVAKNFNPFGGSGDLDYDAPLNIAVLDSGEDIPDGPWAAKAPPPPTKKVWSLAIDAPNVGTQTFLFYDETDLDDFIWENCIDDYDRDTDKIRRDYKNDHEKASSDGMVRENVTYEYEAHEVPAALPNATQFIKDMARFATPEDLFEIGGYESAEEYMEDLGADRAFGEYQAFMHMVREAREILKGEKA